MTDDRRARALLLDLDGTLADTAPDLTDALDRALQANGYPGVDPAAVLGFISGGGRAMVECALGSAVPVVERDRIRHQFLDEYLARVCVRTRLYPGMPEVLRHVEHAGLPWGIVTNKLTLYTTPLVRGLGLETRAGCVVCGDTLALAKPHPEPLLHAAALLGRAPTECIYVGDHARDIQAGRAAGMRTLGALFGYIETGVDVRDWGADACIADATGILEWLDIGQ